MAASMEPGTFGLGRNLAAEGIFIWLGVESIMINTSAVIIYILTDLPESSSWILTLLLRYIH